MNQYILAIALMVVTFNSYAFKKGDVTPDIPLPQLEGQSAGKATSITDYKGKLVYLDFWASWCGPCRQSLPILNEIRKDYASKGFEVVAVNVDENLKDALKFLDKYPVDYPILLDPKGKMPKTYKVQGMPTAYLIDEKGVVLYKHTGFKKKDRKKIEALIDKHLASK